MTSTPQRKGDQAERELAKLLSDQLGVRVRRTWSLVLTGRRVRNWGFYVPASAVAGHYVPHAMYDALGRRELTVQEDGWSADLDPEPSPKETS